MLFLLFDCPIHALTAYHAPLCPAYHIHHDRGDPTPVVLRRLKMSSAIMHIDSPGLTPPPPLTAVFETRSTDKAGNGDIEEGVSDEEMPEVDGAGDDYELERAENIK